MASRTYDVFLSFRGQDTRFNFISHLHYALTNANMKTFIDEHLPRGDMIPYSIFKAIKTSRVAIIVFSPNFASSTWCLDEVAKILECKHSRGQPLILPVFFHVDPSDIQKQTGVFQPVFAKLEEEFRDDIQKVDKWRRALQEVANIAGYHIPSNVPEAELVHKIVKEVYSICRLMKSSL